MERWLLRLICFVRSTASSIQFVLILWQCNETFSQFIGSLSALRGLISNHVVEFPKRGILVTSRVLFGKEIFTLYRVIIRFIIVCKFIFNTAERELVIVCTTMYVKVHEKAFQN